jgi:hypothetical protein
MNSAEAETVPDNTNPIETVPEKNVTRARRSRENSGDENQNCCIRYFLGKAEANGGFPALDKEVNTEGEALVEALRQGVTFYAVEEFRVIADLAGRRPQLTKEPVPGKQS